MEKAKGLKEKIQILRGKERIDLTLDYEESTVAKKVYKGYDSKGRFIKHIELDMQPKDKNKKLEREGK